jgi:hypothetical protein
MMRRLTVTMLLAVGLGSGVAAAESLLERTLDPPFGWKSSGLTVTSAGRLAFVIAVYGKVPVGFEGPRDEPSTAPAGEGILHYGATVRDALELLPQIDPTYRWLNIGGVIVIRPMRAWVDKKNPLNQPAPDVTWQDVPIGYAVTYLTAVVRHQRPPGDPSSAMPCVHVSGTLTLQKSPGSILDMLNKIVLGYGNLQWTVDYASKRSRPVFSTSVRFIPLGEGPGCGMALP